MRTLLSENETTYRSGEHHVAAIEGADRRDERTAGESNLSTPGNCSVCPD